jgi:hypothetical protein
MEKMKLINSSKIFGKFFRAHQKYFSRFVGLCVVLLLGIIAVPMYSVPVIDNGGANDEMNNLQSNRDSDSDECWKVHYRSNWKEMKHFNYNETAYGIYLQSMLKNGMRVGAIRSSDKIQERDTGTFVKWNDVLLPPCLVNWKNYGSPFWVDWKDIIICEPEERGAREL